MRYEAVAFGERATEWQKWFGRTVFPLKSPLPFLAQLPEIGLAFVYLLDFEALSQADQDTPFSSESFVVE